MKNVKEKFKINNFIKLLFMFVSLAFALPSIIYMLFNKTVLNFDKEFYFLLNDSNRTIQAIIYLILISTMIIIYFYIVKNRNKIFDKIDEIYKYIFIISIIFLLIIPFECSDIFYYLGIGRLNSEYGQNPYYITMKEFVDDSDEVDLQKDTVICKGYNNYWSNTTVVYGPVWTIICSIIAKMSFGNIDFRIIII